jgi:hypothetical protein
MITYFEARGASKKQTGKEKEITVGHQVNAMMGNSRKPRMQNCPMPNIKSKGKTGIMIIIVNIFSEIFMVNYLEN